MKHYWNIVVILNRKTIYLKQNILKRYKIKNILITETAKSKIESILLDKTQLNWSVSTDYEYQQSKIVNEQLRLNGGIFDCFLAHSIFKLSSYTDGVKILFVYTSKITYRNGGTNGFECRFFFDLDGDLIEIKY